MLSKTLIQALLALGTTVAAIPTVPTWRTHSGRSLVQALRTRGLSNITDELSPDAEIFTTESPEFANHTTRWSAWSAPSFNTVFVPAEEEDISTALKYMTSHNVSFLAQGGGHGTSVQLGEVHDAVAINMENFNHVTVNPDQTVSVGGGSRFGDIYPVVHAAGRELTLGNCPCVGASGAVLGGGHGRLQGKHGLSADALLKVRMILWDGSVIEASATENADLFWGMRGAGHNFGIVTELTFRSWPQENDGLHYNAAMEFTTESLEGLLTIVNDIIPDQDPALAIDMFFHHNLDTLTPLITLNVVYAGPRETGERFTNLFATNNSTTNPINRTFLNETVVPWDVLPHVVANGMIDDACIDGPSTNLYGSSEASFDVAETRRLFDDYVVFVQQNPLAATTLVFNEIFGQTAVQAQPAEDTSVGNRAHMTVLTLAQAVYTDESVAAAGDAWARSWRDSQFDPAHSGYDRPAVYLNYAHGDEAPEAFYGYEPWRLERLRALKKKYDPRGFFNSYHPFF